MKWSQTLNLSSHWKLAEANQLTPNSLALSIATKLCTELTTYQDQYVEGERQQLIELFRFASKNVKLTMDDLDDLMEDLYDWGDINIGNDEKVCWIRTHD